MDKATIVSGIESASYPVMRAAYADYPITTQEAVHLAEFISAGSTPAGLGPDVVTWSGVALALVALIGVFLHVNRRPAGVRVTLVRRSSSR